MYQNKSYLNQRAKKKKNPCRNSRYQLIQCGHTHHTIERLRRTLIHNCPRTLNDPEIKVKIKIYRALLTPHDQRSVSTPRDEEFLPVGIFFLLIFLFVLYLKLGRVFSGTTYLDPVIIYVCS